MLERCGTEKKKMGHIFCFLHLKICVGWTNVTVKPTKKYICRKNLIKIHVQVPGKFWKVTLSPGAAPLGGSRISTLSGELAHMTMACDTTPLILAGLRLHIRTAMRFCICTEKRENNNKKKANYQNSKFRKMITILVKKEWRSLGLQNATVLLFWSKVHFLN